MKKLQRFLPLIILLSFVIVISIAIIRNSTTIKLEDDQISNHFEAESLRSKIKLPEFSLPDLFNENKNFSIQDLLNNNNKYSIINFFASWCASCASEQEALLSLKQENIVDIYGVAWRDFKKETIKFLDKNGNPYKKTAIDSSGLFTKMLGIKAVPETVIVDSKGNVVMRYQGIINSEIINEIKNFLQKNRD